MFQIPKNLSHKIEHIHQIGGIQTALIDFPCPGGKHGAGGRVAMFNTGSGLRFTVNIERGGDIGEAFYNQYGLAYLSSNGVVPPAEGHKTSDNGWMRSWPGGLVTTCGPMHTGSSRDEDGQHVTQHGHHSNTPAAVVAIRQPDLHALHQDPNASREMSIEMIIRDNSNFAQFLEVRRIISCTLGESVIRINDTVTNVSGVKLPHNLLYHINFGYPFLDTDTQFIYGGRTWLTLDPKDTPTSVEALNKLKTVPSYEVRTNDPLSSFCAMVEDITNSDGIARTGVINRKLKLGFEISFPVEQLPRLTNWQCLNDAGCFIAAVEPYSGSLMGKNKEPITEQQAGQYLQPGESRQYDVTMRLHTDKSDLDQFAACDAPLSFYDA